MDKTQVKLNIIIALLILILLVAWKISADTTNIDWDVRSILGKIVSQGR